MTRDTANKVRHRWILGVAAVGILLCGYPGLMATDSADQLTVARNWDPGDWHPPVMSLLWKSVELVIAGPFGMFLLQVIGFTLGAYWVLRQRLSEMQAAIVVISVAWCPPVLTTMIVVWKDAPMAALLLLGIAGLAAGGRRRTWLAIGAFALASALRHNAPAATFAPLLLLWSYGTRWRRVVLAAGVWIACTVASAGVNSLLVQRHEHPWVISIAVTDIVGTMRNAPRIDDAEARELLAGTPLRVTHDIQAAMLQRPAPISWLTYYPADPVIGWPYSASEQEAVTRAWGAVVRAYPLAYLEHRSTLFKKMIRLGGGTGLPPLMLSLSSGDPQVYERLQHEASPSGIQRAMFWLLRHVSGLWYSAYLYLVLALVLVPFASRDRLVFALLGSGVGYELSFFIVAPSADYRYSHWLAVTTLLAAVLVVARRASRRRVA